MTIVFIHKIMENKEANMQEKILFLNISNHKLNQEQIDYAKKHFKVTEFKDISFPNINPKWDLDEIKYRAKEFIETKIRLVLKNYDKIYFYIMGELSFFFQLSTTLIFEKVEKMKNWIFVVSTTKRISKEKNGKKISEFKFEKFRRIY